MHRWRVRARLPERFGQPCRVLVVGRMNSVLVEFADGYRVLTPHLVKTSWQDGLQDEHVERLIAMLGHVTTETA
jgi:hypothetical protein